MKVAIPYYSDAKKQYTGKIMLFSLVETCPICHFKRGVKRWKGKVWIGNKERQIEVDCWDNECGHVDKYSDVMWEGLDAGYRKYLKNKHSNENTPEPTASQKLRLKEKQRIIFEAHERIAEKKIVYRVMVENTVRLLNEKLIREQKEERDREEEKRLVYEELIKALQKQHEKEERERLAVEMRERKMMKVWLKEYDEELAERRAWMKDRLKVMGNAKRSHVVSKGKKGDMNHVTKSKGLALQHITEESDKGYYERNYVHIEWQVMLLHKFEYQMVEIDDYNYRYTLSDILLKEQLL